MTSIAPPPDDEASESAGSTARAVVLLPSARLVAHEMRSEVGAIPPCLIPYRGKSTLQLLVESYLSLSERPRIVLAVCEGKELVKRALERSILRIFSIEVVEVPRLERLGDTILHALDVLSLDPRSPLTVHFPDTLISNLDVSPVNRAWFARISEAYRWTTFSERDGAILGIAEKHEVDDHENANVFTGVFSITDLAAFTASLRAESTASSGSAIDPFYRALLAHFRSGSYQLIESEGWLDLGHLDNYLGARKHTVNERFFNRITIDPHRAIVKKESTDRAKLEAETAWYRELPPALKCYAPQLFDANLDATPPNLRLEYYGYPVVADLFFYGGHQRGIWFHFLEALELLLEDMRRFPSGLSGQRRKSEMESMYLSKTVERLGSLRGHPVIGPLLEVELVINERRTPSVERLLELLPTIVERELLGNGDDFCVIHGDLCFSNILFDPRTRILKLLDPRGSFGSSGIFGDRRYDLAKLSHSFHGLYDLIVRDGFFLFCDGAELSLSIHSEPHHIAVGDIFRKRFAERFPIESRAVRLIESLLFLSMPPLHADHPNRQLAMLARGLEGIAEFCE